MANIHPITKTEYADKTWKKFPNYAFAINDSVVALVAQEFPRACMSMPIAFIKPGEEFMPVAVQGLDQNQNLYVGPDGGWIGPYTPAAYRGYPFSLGSAANDQQVLCIDHDSGLLDETGQSGEPFYDENGEPTKLVVDLMNFLLQVRKNRQSTRRVCATLQKHDLFQPWPVQVKIGGEEHQLQGLYCVNEHALNNLPELAFYELRAAGCLPFAYAQLLSMQNIQRLQLLANARQAAGSKAVPANQQSGDIDLEFLNSDGTIKLH